MELIQVVNGGDHSLNYTLEKILKVPNSNIAESIRSGCQGLDGQRHQCATGRRAVLPWLAALGWQHDPDMPGLWTYTPP